MLIDDDFARSFSEEWILAWNEHDIDRIVSHYDEEIEFVSPLILKRLPDLGGVIRDKDTLKRYFEMGLSARPDLRFKLIGVLTSVRGFVIFYENAFKTHSAEYVEINSEGLVRLSIACYSERALF